MGRVAAEERDPDDLVADCQVIDPLAERIDDARHLETRGDGPPDELPRRGVQTHSHNDVGVVDSSRHHGDAHGPRTGFGGQPRLDSEALVAPGALDDNFLESDGVRSGVYGSC